MRYRLKAKSAPTNWNHYRRATFVSVCLGTSLVIVLGFYNGTELFAGDWVTDFAICSGMIGHFLASSTYIARIIDLLEKRDRSLHEHIELGLTLPFAVIGLLVGITLCLIQHIIVSFLGILNDVLLFIMRAIGAYAGIGNRLGSLPRRPPIERIALILFTCLGLGIGIFLFCTGGLGCLSVPGLSTLITSSTIAKYLSIGYIASSYASAGDYASKGYRFYRAITRSSLEEKNNTPEEIEENKQLQQRICEYTGSCFLALTGLLVAMLLLPAAISFGGAATMIISCVSIFGGIGSRLGALADAYYQISPIEEDASYMEPKNKDTDSTTSTTSTTIVTSLLISSSNQAPITMGGASHLPGNNTQPDANGTNNSTKPPTPSSASEPTPPYQRCLIL